MSTQHLIALTLALATLSGTPPARAAPTPINASVPQAPPNNDARISLSADGRYVAFDAQPDLSCRPTLTSLGAAPSTPACVVQVYVYDRARKTTELVSRTPAGTPANGDSTHPTISADGRYVAFRSAATNLVTGKAGALPYFVRDRTAKKTVVVKTPAGARFESARLYLPRISGDGQVVVVDPNVDTRTGQWGGDERGALLALWWRTGRMVVATVAASGQNATHAAAEFGLSRTARYVAFTTLHPIVPADTDTTEDVYVRDTVARRTVSATATIPDECDAVSTVRGCTTAYTNPCIDDAGRTVAFVIRGPRTGSTSNNHLGVRDLVTGKTKVLSFDSIAVDTSAAPSGVPGPGDIALSGDGRHVFFVLSNEVSASNGYTASLWHWNLATGAVTRLAGQVFPHAGSGSFYSSTSAPYDGRSAGVVTTAPLASNDTDDQSDAYVLAGL